MAINPYEAPREAEVVGVVSGKRDDLRAVAMYQKGVIVAILLYLAVIVAQFMLPPQAIIFIGLAGFMAMLLGAASAILLSVKVYGPIVGLLMGLLVLIPLLGLIVLLLINNRATRTMRDNDIEVGLFGARMSQI